MRSGLPKDWTEIEVRRLTTLARRKLGADDIARVLGRPDGSVRRKARSFSVSLVKDERELNSRMCFEEGQGSRQRFHVR